jgi:putative hemolysin
MLGSIEFLVISFLFFTWFVSAWEFLNMLSWGRARKTDSVDRDLSDVMELWLAERPAYDIVFKILLFADIALFSISSVIISKSVDYQLFNLDENYSALLWVLVALVFGEAIAKAILIKFDIMVLRITMPIIYVLRKTLFFPIVLLSQGIQSCIEHIQHYENSDVTTAEDEIMSFLEKDDDDSDGDSSIEEDEKKMIKGIFELDDTFVREIMVPRVDVHGIELKTSINDAKKEFIKTGHSRVPVYDTTIDEIKGIVYAKDFLDDDKIKGIELKDMLHKPFYIPESKPVDDLLDEFKKNNTHMAVVIDEYGGIAGIVTFEDIIEEIVGEIQDEYDTESDEDCEVEWLDDNTVVLSARTLISDVNELFDAEISEDDGCDTIGGVVCEVLGKIPKVGEVANITEDLSAEVLDADKRRVIKLKIMRG